MSLKRDKTHLIKDTNKINRVLKSLQVAGVSKTTDCNAGFKN